MQIFNRLSNSKCHFYFLEAFHLLFCLVKTLLHPFLLQHENSSLPVGNFFEDNKAEEDEDESSCLLSVISTIDSKLEFC